MAFRIKILTPIRADERDLARRRQRYGERAAPGTEIEVIGLSAGPRGLESRADLAASEDAVFERGAAIAAHDCDAVLVDCIFDPAVDRLRAALPMPVFGPFRTALSVLCVVVPSFGIIARTNAHEAVFREMVEGYGHGDRLVAVRSLGLSYPEGRVAERFDAAMREQLAAVVGGGGARAVVMGSTTIAVPPAVAAVAGGVPLVLTGMMTLGIMESLWRDGLLSPARPG